MKKIGMEKRSNEFLFDFSAENCYNCRKGLLQECPFCEILFGRIVGKETKFLSHLGSVAQW